MTTQQEILHSAAEQRYALDVQATVELMGKRIAGKLINRILQTATDGSGEIVSSRQLPDQPVAVSEQAVPCQVWEITYNDENHLLVDRLYYSPEHFPHILRRETTPGAGSESVALPAERVQSVVALEMPYLVDGQVLRCSCLETTRRGDKGSSVRVSLVSEQVPGGEVAVWTTDFDPEGRRSRWSSQALMGYGQQLRADTKQSRREMRRSRRTSR